MRSLAILVIMMIAASAALADVREADRMLAEAEQLRATDKAKSRQLLADAQRMLSATSDPLVRAKLMVCRGIVLQLEGRSREAETEYAAAAAIAGQGRAAIVEAGARGKLAWLQYHRGAMADSLANLQTAYRITSQLGDEKGRLDALSMMANVYADAKVAQYDRAIEYYRQLAVEYEKLGMPKDIADTLFNIGSTFETKGNFAAAEFHYRRALAAFELLQRPGDVAYTRCALGSSLTKQGRGNEALPHFNASLAFYEEEGDAESLAWVHQFRGIAYRRLGRGEEALRDLGAARAFYEKEKNTRFLEKNTEETALVYEQLGDWRNAAAFRKRYSELQQELAVARRDELSSRLRVQFDAEKKEQENRALTRENALRAAALREAERNQKLQLAVITLTALLAVALAVLFWRQVANTRRMRTMAMTDDLTRLPNRRHILTALELAFAEARRHGHPVALIVLDIDRFKRINDTYGHAAGDEILKRVARACRLTLRPSDQIGRIGGEEFLIVLHETVSAQQAADIAERLRAAVEQLDASSVADGLRVTISLGVFVTNDYDANAAVAAADTLLYRAKEDGRNRVVAAGGGTGELAYEPAGVSGGGGGS